MQHKNAESISPLLRRWRSYKVVFLPRTSGKKLPCQFTSNTAETPDTKWLLLFLTSGGAIMNASVLTNTTIFTIVLVVGLVISNAYHFHVVPYFQNQLLPFYPRHTPEKKWRIVASQILSEHKLMQCYQYNNQ